MTADPEIQLELSPGERVLWSGRPRPGLRLQTADLALIPFSLMWGGFAVFWEASVVAKGAPMIFKLWGIPFVAAGAYIAVGRFFVDARQRANTWYALTDQRILIVSGLRSRQVKSLSLEGLGEISLRTQTDRSGTISFGPMPGMTALYAGTGWPGVGKRVPPMFDMIPDAKAVYEAIRAAQRTPRPPLAIPASG